MASGANSALDETTPCSSTTVTPGVVAPTGGSNTRAWSVVPSASVNRRGVPPSSARRSELYGSWLKVGPGTAISANTAVTQSASRVTRASEALRRSRMEGFPR